MRVAFYAPMKPPSHPVPSGDRRMARAFMALLRDIGHEVELASTFRSFDRDGDAARQARLERLGAKLAARYLGHRQAPAARSVVHLPPLPQGAGLAGASRQPGAARPLRGGRGVACGQAGRRAMGGGL